MQQIAINPTLLAQIGMGTLRVLLLDHHPDLVLGDLHLTPIGQDVPGATVTLTSVTHCPAADLSDAIATAAGARDASAWLAQRRRYDLTLTDHTLLTILVWERVVRDPLPKR